MDRRSVAGPRLRASLERIAPYVPGGTGDESSWKLSSNENPYPPLPGVLEAVLTSAQQLNRYPDQACTALTRALAEQLAVPPEHICVGTGSSALLQQLMAIAVEPGDEVVYAWRSFESYPIATQWAAGRPVEVPLAADEAHDLDAMVDAITERTRVVLVCTPNNPTGRALRHDDLERFLERVPESTLVVLDEAYVEFDINPLRADGLELYRDRNNVVVLRTFSKAYGLAGARVGYAVAPRPIAEALRKVAVPFGVSALAQSAALASLERHDELMHRVAAIVAERTRVRDELREQGWWVPDSQANFVWLRLGARSAEFASACERAGVMVRRYGQDGVRVTIGEREADDAFLAAAAAFRRS